MARSRLIAALTVIVATPLWAQPDPAPVTAAPPTPAEARYCLHVGPLTGEIVERVECWTRAEWAEQGVDVDKELPKEGVPPVRPG
jgi:hypothetical protein